MTFKEKIYKILRHNKLELNSVEDIAAKVKVNASTIRKGMGKQNGMKPENVKKLVDGLGINWNWWDDGVEPIFTENHTPAINNDEQPVIEEQKKDPAVEDRILKKLDSLTDNVNGFGDFNRFLLKEIDRLRKKVIDLGGEI